MIYSKRLCPSTSTIVDLNIIRHPKLLMSLYHLSQNTFCIILIYYVHNTFSVFFTCLPFFCCFPPPLFYTLASVFYSSRLESLWLWSSIWYAGCRRNILRCWKHGFITICSGALFCSLFFPSRAYGHDSQVYTRM
jgi:hypothetical protein